ncbi:MAG: HAD hydrolase family protein [Clostridia bacterium]
MTNKRTERTTYYETLSGYGVEECDEDLYEYMVKNKIIAYKVLAFVKENTALQEVERYKEIFGDVAQVSCSKSNLIEFVSLEAGKGEMCLKLADLLGIDKSEVMTFGDGLNDLSLISLAGFGVAMGNAFKQTQQAAKYVTDTNINDGVRKAIEKFVFNDKE